MKRTFLISSLMLLASGCASDPIEPPPAGGQSGDDGDVILPPGPGPTEPGLPMLPPEPCDPEEANLALDAATAFGGSAQELLAGLELGAPSPLFWVPRSAVPAVTFSPGPGEASLTLEVTARATAGTSPVTQTLWTPQFAGAICRDDSLRVPVQVSLRSSDGALDERVDGVLEFSSAKTAHLEAELQPDALAGSFAYTEIGAPGEDWQAESLTVSADFWPGGNRGALWPSFSTGLDPSRPANPPPTATPTPSTPISGSGLLVPTIPTDWGSIAVWPRREACNGDGRGRNIAVPAGDPIIGTSLAAAVAAQNARSPFVLASGEELTPVNFALEVPAGLQCVSVYGRSLTFDVRATLRTPPPAGYPGALVAAPQSPLEHLAASSIFELTATNSRDGSGLESLRWVRRDLVWAESRASFETATGIALGAAEQYEQVWWSWHGTETRASATAPWSSLGELAVHSLNAQQSAALERQQAQGGPGAGISFDEETHFPVLPGDALIEAEISP